MEIIIEEGDNDGVQFPSPKAKQTRELPPEPAPSTSEAVSTESVGKRKTSRKLKPTQKSQKKYTGAMFVVKNLARRYDRETRDQFGLGVPMHCVTTGYMPNV